MTDNGRFWMRMAAVTLAVTVIITPASVAWGMPWSSVVRSAVALFLFASVITTLCALTLSRLKPLSRFAFPWSWVVLVAALALLAVAGTVVVITLLSVTGLIERSDSFTWFAESIGPSVVITLIFGIFTTSLETTRGRLDDTTLALRTKERDEAEARRLAAESQRASLEARVNPHFFFNTLNSIAALIRDDPAGAERMTSQLASLMRSSLHDGSSPLVPLDHELQSVRDYLEIERVRFGDRLRFEITVAETARTALVPRLSLQTLVENSVKYAVLPRREGASLAVTAVMADQSRVRIDVTDDGPGFDLAAAPEGHGISLLRSRLAMAFGDRAALTVDSGPGRTTVSLALPLIPLDVGAA